MDISALSSFLNTASPRQQQALEAGDFPLRDAANAHSPRADHAPGLRVGRGFALRAFRYELRTALNAHFGTVHSTTPSPYAGDAESTGPDQVADEALGVARRVVAQSPTTAAKTLLEFRSRVEESARFAHHYVAEQPDLGDVDRAVARVDEGLIEMEQEAAATRESSSSILDVDMAARQRSVIRIRTQEGDVVKLSLKQVSMLSASASEQVDGDTTTSNTEIEFSSRSRMMLKVRGDLNEAELGAIHTVIGRAQEFADAFFSGDIGAAFNSVPALEFDSEQLAGVNMRFRLRQSGSVTYSETIAAIPAVADEPAPVLEPESAVAPTIAADPEISDGAAADSTAEDLAAASDGGGQDLAAPRPDALSGFFDIIGSFLRSVSEGFAGASGSTTIRYQHSESFKLHILQAVIHTAAPDDASDAADNAVQALETLSA